MPALLVNAHTAAVFLYALTLCDIDDHDAASNYVTVQITQGVPSTESLEHQTSRSRGVHIHVA